MSPARGAHGSGGGDWRHRECESEGGGLDGEQRGVGEKGENREGVFCPSAHTEVTFTADPTPSPSYCDL